jgi:SNF2 family DNA or RNA helicase
MHLRQHEYCRLDGATDQATRTEQIDAFNEEGMSYDS